MNIFICFSSFLQRRLKQNLSGWRGGFWYRQICQISKDDVGPHRKAGHKVIFDDDNFWASKFKSDIANNVISCSSIICRLVCVIINLLANWNRQILTGIFTNSLICKQWWNHEQTVAVCVIDLLDNWNR